MGRLLRKNCRSKPKWRPFPVEDLVGRVDATGWRCEVNNCDVAEPRKVGKKLVVVPASLRGDEQSAERPFGPVASLEVGVS